MTHLSFDSYKILFSAEALKELHKLDRLTAKKIVEKIKQLRSNTKQLNVKKLKNTNHNLYRLRVGNFRVIYSVKHEQLTLHILFLGHRKEIYKKIS